MSMMEASFNNNNSMQMAAMGNRSEYRSQGGQRTATNFHPAAASMPHQQSMTQHSLNQSFNGSLGMGTNMQ